MPEDSQYSLTSYKKLAKGLHPVTNLPEGCQLPVTHVKEGCPNNIKGQNSSHTSEERKILDKNQEAKVSYKTIRGSFINNAISVDITNIHLNLIN